MMGGYYKENPMDNEVRSKVTKFKSEVESRLGKHFSKFEPLSYSTQVVAGKNYKVRIAVDEGKTILVTFNEALPSAGGQQSLSEATYA